MHLVTYYVNKDNNRGFSINGAEGGIELNREIISFIDKYVKEIQNNNAAIFAGAGFSKGAGYVDWKNLIRGIADDLQLDVDKENDLVSLAQYSYNKNQNNHSSSNSNQDMT